MLLQHVYKIIVRELFIFVRPDHNLIICRTFQAHNCKLQFPSNFKQYLLYRTYSTANTTSWQCFEKPPLEPLDMVFISKKYVSLLIIKWFSSPLHVCLSCLFAISVYFNVSELVIKKADTMSNVPYVTQSVLRVSSMFFNSSCNVFLLFQERTRVKAEKKNKKPC